MSVAKVQIAIVCLLASMLCAGTIPNSFAETKIAVIDPQFLLWNCNAAKTVRQQSDRIRAQYQQEFKSRQDEIDKLYEKLSAERATLTPAAYQQRALDLQQKATVYQREAQERLSNLDTALNGTSQKILAAMTQVVDEIIKENKFSLVLPRSMSVGTPSAPDITQEVLNRLNQRLPAVSIDLGR